MSIYDRVFIRVGFFFFMYPGLTGPGFKKKTLWDSSKLVRVEKKYFTNWSGLVKRIFTIIWPGPIFTGLGLRKFSLVTNYIYKNRLHFITYTLWSVNDFYSWNDRLSTENNFFNLLLKSHSDSTRITDFYQLINFIFLAQIGNPIASEI